MTDSYTRCRNKLIYSAYAHVLKPLFFRSDPEAIHDRMTKVGARLGRHSWGRAITGGLFDYQNDMLRQNILGLEFKNPIGLSAGFDKNAELTDILPSVGFGFAEAGSITGESCEGNPKPRLWRLPASQSLVVYYGLKNDGCEAIAARLKDKHARRPFAIPVGISVAMTNCSANLETGHAVADFVKAFRVMEPYASYITVNVSCPNIQAGKPFTEPDKLERLLSALDPIPTTKPVFIKLSPDLSHAEIDRILEVARPHRVQGIITTNLTKNRDNPRILDADVPKVGGLSGKVVQEGADDALAYIYKKEGKRFLFIGSGGVFTAEDAYKKIRLGASLVQLITGMIYEGPQVVGEINRGLVALLKRDGFANMSQAIGVDNC